MILSGVIFLDGNKNILKIFLLILMTSVKNTGQSQIGDH